MASQMQLLMKSNERKWSILWVEDEKWYLYNTKSACRHYITYIFRHICGNLMGVFVFFPGREKVNDGELKGPPPHPLWKHSYAGQFSRML